MDVSATKVMILLGLGTCACGSVERNEDPVPVRIATFNAGLASGYEPYVSERKLQIEVALSEKAQALDIMCVQEYWDERDWNDLVAATASELPHVLRRPPEPGPASCTTAELDPLVACLGSQCAGATGQELVSCALDRCGEEVTALSSGCAACVTKDLELPLDQIYQGCTSGAGGAGNPDDTPALFGGTFDVGLLSRHSFLEHDSKRLDAFLVRVAVLYGKIATAAGDLHVFCTHLTSEIGDWKYGGSHGSWSQENAFEAQQLAEYVSEKAGDGAPVLILGDLNTGPAADGIDAEWPESFAALTGAGFAAPFLSQSDASCTLCPDNTLRSPDSRPKLVDHVLVRGFAGSSTVERFFTYPASVPVQGTSMSMHLSDHYGLQATLQR